MSKNISKKEIHNLVLQECWGKIKALACPNASNESQYANAMLSLHYYDQGHIAKAEDLALKTLESEDFDARFWSMASFGRAVSDSGEIRLGISYLRRAQEMAESLSATNYLASARSGVARIFLDNELIDNALAEYESALETCSFEMVAALPAVVGKARALIAKGIKGEGRALLEVEVPELIKIHRAAFPKVCIDVEIYRSVAFGELLIDENPKESINWFSRARQLVNKHDRLVQIFDLIRSRVIKVKATNGWNAKLAEECNQLLKSLKRAPSIAADRVRVLQIGNDRGCIDTQLKTCAKIQSPSLALNALNQLSAVAPRRYSTRIAAEVGLIRSTLPEGCFI